MISQVPWADIFTSIVAPVAATVATLVGLVVALSQLTAGARLRKQADYWKQEYLDTDLAQDKLVYQSMHRLAVGKIVARTGVPLRRITVAACYLLPVTILLVSVTHFLFSHPATDGWVLFALGAIAGVIAFFIALGEYSVLNSARRDVLVSFLDGNRIISDFNVWPDRRRAFRVLGRRGVVEVLIVSISACAVVVAATVAMIALSNEGAAVPGWATPITYLAYPSVIYLIFAIAGSSNFKRGDVWIHPRPLTAAARLATDKSLKRSDEEAPMTDDRR